MELTVRSTIFLALLAGGAAQTCNPQELTECQTDMTDQVSQGQSAGSTILCNAVAEAEACLNNYGKGCPLATTQPLQTAIDSTKKLIDGQYGFDCLKSQSTTLPVTSSGSGDSGLTSGSTPSKSSGSSGTSSGYWLPWQVILLLCCLCLCCGGAGGGAFYAMKGGKKKPKKSVPQDYPPEAEPLQQYQEPIAQVAVDVDNDGKADYIVTGVDANNDGIPDALQGDKLAPVEVQAVPQAPKAPQPVYYEAEPMPMAQPMAQPAMFGPLQPLMPGPMTTAYPATSYPATTYPTTSYAQPYATSYASPVMYSGGGVI